eukprot:COSAG02_NODE_19922_length_858_cov_0.996047_1_plen_169_part_10
MGGGAGGRTVCLVRSRANWRRPNCPAARRPGGVSRKRPASKEILRRLLLLRAVDCVPLPRLVVQLLPPDHFASQLGVEGMANVGLHAQRGAGQNGALEKRSPRIRSRRIPEKLQRLAIVVVKTRTDLVKRRRRAAGRREQLCQLSDSAARDGTVGLLRTARRNEKRGTH